MHSKIKKIHMIGIGGAGMSGIAEVLLNQGYEISGSDLSENAVIGHLRKCGANILIGHRPENLGDVQVVVKSTAIDDNNPELILAREKNIPIIPRAEMLAELMRLKYGIAIAGAHGKTTTTSLVAAIFEAAALDPTVIIGGRLNVYGANAHLGKGKYLIAEADESDGSFLCLFPIINIITNIDDDHLDHYGNSEKLDDAFLRFMNQVPFYGLNIVCGDCERIRNLLPQVKRSWLTFGFGSDNNFQAKMLENGSSSSFEVMFNGNKLGVAHLALPGAHNVLNALGAIGAALSSGISFEQCAAGLTAFRGVGRRFELKGEKNGIIVIDDYGHHPSEISATIKAAREVYPQRRLVAAFQPHRFSRTQALFGEFCKVFKDVDELLLTEIYAASEEPIPGISGQSLAQGIMRTGFACPRYYQTIDELLNGLDEILQPGDLLLTLGAGSITKVGSAWLGEMGNA